MFLTCSAVVVLGDQRASAAAALVLDAIVTAPTVLLVTLVAFGIAFRSEIRAFLERITEVAFPGGGGVKASQQQARPLEAAPPLDVAGQAAAAADREQAPELQLRSLGEEALSRCYADLNMQLRYTRYWYLTYLASHLTGMTQGVLRWFQGLEAPVSVSSFHEIWAPHIKELSERMNIVNTLLQFNLIQVHGQMLSIHESGRAFLAFLDGEWRPLDDDSPPEPKPEQDTPPRFPEVPIRAKN